MQRDQLDLAIQCGLPQYMYTHCTCVSAIDGCDVHVHCTNAGVFDVHSFRCTDHLHRECDGGEGEIPAKEGNNEPHTVNWPHTAHAASIARLCLSKSSVQLTAHYSVTMPTLYTNTVRCHMQTRLSLEMRLTIILYRLSHSLAIFEIRLVPPKHKRG